MAEINPLGLGPLRAPWNTSRHRWMKALSEPLARFGEVAVLRVKNVALEEVCGQGQPFGDGLVTAGPLAQQKSR